MDYMQNLDCMYGFLSNYARPSSSDNVWTTDHGTRVTNTRSLRHQAFEKPFQQLFRQQQRKC
jgi:hypothetical protein